MLKLDCSIVWQVIEKEPNTMLLSHIHKTTESLLPDSPFDAVDHFPWVLNQVLQGGMVTINSPKELPPEADRDRQTFQD